jgi:serine acetyltransferase
MIRLPHSWSEIRRSFTEERWRRRVAANTTRALTPPRRHAFGAFGEDTYVVPPALISSPELIFLGDRVLIQEHSWLSVVAAAPGVTPRLTIGSGTHILRMCHIACIGEIEIGPNCMIAERVLIGDTYHDYRDPQMPILDQPMVTPEKVTIRAGAYVGAGSVVLMGVTIGENAYVGAGAVVTRDVEARTLVVGNPARPVSRWDPNLAAWISGAGTETAV